jgi:hypothetical protein
VLYPPRPARLASRCGSSNVHVGDRGRRCAAYLAKLPASIAGAGGHDRLLHAACTTIRFGVSDSDALSLLREYNRRAQPAWDDADLERKLSEARKLASGQEGSMLVDRPKSEPLADRHRRRRTILTGGGR